MISASGTRRQNCPGFRGDLYLRLVSVIQKYSYAICFLITAWPASIEVRQGPGNISIRYKTYLKRTSDPEPLAQISKYDSDKAILKLNAPSSNDKMNFLMISKAVVLRTQQRLAYHLIPLSQLQKNQVSHFFSYHFCTIIVLTKMIWVFISSWNWSCV